MQLLILWPCGVLRLDLVGRGVYDSRPQSRSIFGSGDGRVRAPKGIDEAVEEVQQGYWPTTRRALPPISYGLIDSDFDWIDD